MKPEGIEDLFSETIAENPQLFRKICISRYRRHSDSHSHFIVKMQRIQKRKLKTVEKNTTSLIKEKPSDQQISQQNAKGQELSE